MTNGRAIAAGLVSLLMASGCAAHRMSLQEARDKDYLKTLSQKAVTLFHTMIDAKECTTNLPEMEIGNAEYNTINVSTEKDGSNRTYQRIQLIGDKSTVEVRLYEDGAREVFVYKGDTTAAHTTVAHFTDAGELGIEPTPGDSAFIMGINGGQIDPTKIGAGGLSGVNEGYLRLYRTVEQGIDATMANINACLDGQSAKKAEEARQRKEREEQEQTQYRDSVTQAIDNLLE